MLTFDLQSQIHVSQWNTISLNILPPHIKQETQNSISDLLI